MKYLLPLTLAAAAALGAQSSWKGATLPLAGAAPHGPADPPWLSNDWPARLEAPVSDADDPHAGLYGDDPHAGLYGDDPHAGLYGDDPHAGLYQAESGAASAECPAGGDRLDSTATPDDVGASDPHATAVGRVALLEAGLEPRVVTRSTAPNGRTIAEIHAQRAQLREHRVRVRATVVKRTDGILGKSYLHVWDGSAARDTSEDDLTVTTTEEFQIGETVELEGQLLVDQDLGLGYRYAALLDGATRVAN